MPCTKITISRSELPQTIRVCGQIFLVFLAARAAGSAQEFAVSSCDSGEDGTSWLQLHGQQSKAPCHSELCLDKTVLFISVPDISWTKGSHASYTDLLTTAGFIVTAFNASNYTGSPPASSFDLVLISPDGLGSEIIPVVGQQSILAAQQNSTALVLTEWSSLYYTDYATLDPVFLINASEGNYEDNSAGYVEFTFQRDIEHQIWDGLPKSFDSALEDTAYACGNLTNGGTQVASVVATLIGGTSLGCGSGALPFVAIKETTGGRIVHSALAPGYCTLWFQDSNLVALMANMITWAADCSAVNRYRK